jgi:hypothetical protein
LRSIGLNRAMTASRALRSAIGSDREKARSGFSDSPGRGDDEAERDGVFIGRCIDGGAARRYS